MNTHASQSAESSSPIEPVAITDEKVADLLPDQEALPTNYREIYLASYFRVRGCLPPGNMTSGWGEGATTEEKFEGLTSGKVAIGALCAVTHI